MAWRIEKNPLTKESEIVIDGWDKGIARNPYEGIADMRQVNIETVPGEISVGNAITSATVSGATLGKPISRATEYATTGLAASYAILDGSGHVFTSTTLSGTWTSASATTTSAQTTDSIAIWRGVNQTQWYIFHFRNDKIDYATISSGTVGSWTAGWKTITASTQHFAVFATDGVLYFCNGQSIGSLQEKAGQTFDPTNSATYTFTTTALVLPQYDSAQSLAQLGVNLLVGGAQNAIYPWDRVSTSFTYPIYCPEHFIGRMVSANNITFIFAGGLGATTGSRVGRGRIYVTNGTNVDLFFKIPDSITGYQSPYYLWGDAIWHRNKLLFSFEADQSNGTYIGIGGVWAVNLSRQLIQEEPSAFCELSNSNVASVLIPDESGSAIAGLALMLGDYDNTNTYSISYSNTAGGTGTAVVKTDLMAIGSFFSHRTFKTVEFKLGQTLQSGESIQIVPFSDLASTSGTTFNTTGVFSGQVDVNFESGQWLQFQLTLTGNSALSGCRVREIRIR